MTTEENNKMIAEFMTRAKVETHHNQYHSSWNELMPVVEKIEAYGASVIIGRFFCEIKYENPLNQEISFDVKIASGVKMNAVNGAISKFIEWYNENKD